MRAENVGAAGDHPATGESVRNRGLFELVQQDALQGTGVLLSLTDCYRKTDYGEPIVAMKSYIMSPFSREEHTDALLQSLWKARRIIEQEN